MKTIFSVYPARPAHWLYWVLARGFPPSAWAFGTGRTRNQCAPKKGAPHHRRVLAWRVGIVYIYTHIFMPRGRKMWEKARKNREAEAHNKSHWRILLRTSHSPYPPKLLRTPRFQPIMMRRFSLSQYSLPRMLWFNIIPFFLGCASLTFSLSAQLAAQKWLKTKLYLYVFIFARWCYGRNINIFPPLFTAATIQVRRYTRMWQPLTWPGQHMVHRPRQSAAWQMIHRSRVRIVYTERHNRERENGPPRRWWPTTKHCEATNMCLYLSIYLMVNMTSPRLSVQVWTRYQCLRGSSD